MALFQITELGGDPTALKLDEICAIATPLFVGRRGVNNGHITEITYASPDATQTQCMLVVGDAHAIRTRFEHASDSRMVSFLVPPVLLQGSDFQQEREAMLFFVKPEIAQQNLQPYRIGQWMGSSFSYPGGRLGIVAGTPDAVRRRLFNQITNN